MEITPDLKVTRFAQLAPGDLFICPHGDVAFVAMVAKDPTEDGEKVMVPLGPVFPDGVNGPSLVRRARTTVIAFGKEYALRLPTHARGWRANEPASDISCILVTENGAYLRANFRPPQHGEFSACYIDIATGLVQTTGTGPQQQFAPPRGLAAFAVAWEIVTTEKEPRMILAYPAPSGAL